MYQSFKDNFISLIIIIIFAIYYDYHKLRN